MVLAIHARGRRYGSIDRAIVYAVTYVIVRISDDEIRINVLSSLHR